MIVFVPDSDITHAGIILFRSQKEVVHMLIREVDVATRKVIDMVNPRIF